MARSDNDSDSSAPAPERNDARIAGVCIEGVIDDGTPAETKKTRVSPNGAALRVAKQRNGAVQSSRRHAEMQRTVPFQWTALSVP